MSVSRLSARDAYALVHSQGYVYLDVRGVPEFDAGHPHGAYNIPLLVARLGGGADDNPHFVAQVRAVFDADAKLVVTCASGVRSLRASELLLASGFTQVVEQRAGMEGVRDAFGAVQEKGHRAEGLPIAYEALPERSYREICARWGR